jgi:hypothetical protein
MATNPGLIWKRRILYLVSISGRVIYERVSFSFDRQAGVQLTLRTDHQTATLLRTTVDGLDDINQLLLILQNPVQLVVVASTKIAHHVFVAEEEHEGDWVVQFYKRDISANP